MMNKIISYFKYKKAGSIVLEIEAQEENHLSFRVDAVQMQVDWGDGTPVSCGQLTGQFTHQYANKGIYKVLIQGEKITGIDMPECECVRMDVSACETIEYINCTGNCLSELDICNCKALYELYCMRNQLATLKLSKHPNLFYLSCASNCLENLNLHDCRNLVSLYCNQNRLKSLNVRKCRKLITVNLDDNTMGEKALLDFADSLRPRIMGCSGLVSLNGVSFDLLNRVRTIINKKRWFEI